MSKYIFAVLIVLVLILPMKSTIAVEVLYDGSTLPATQGWSVFEQITGPLDISTDGNILTLNTIDVPAKGPSGTTHFFKDVGAEVDLGFAITIRLKVIDVDAPHNFNDSPVAFQASYSGGFGSVNDREQTVFFDEDKIGWGDDLGFFLMDTTVDFHDYKLTVSPNGVALLSVDGIFVLTRTGFQSDGVCAFGDPTNDSMVDSKFQVDSITFDPIFTCSLDIQCDDGDDCNGVDFCKAGSCFDGTPIDCSSFDDICAIGICNPATGECEQDVTMLAGSLCREAVNDCDIEELCDGLVAICPNDRCVAARTPCDFCEPPGICDGDCNCVAKPIPTMSEWGISSMALLLMVAATLVMSRRTVVTN